MPILPIKGVSLLFGNHLAGGKAVADCKVTSKPVTLVSTEKLRDLIHGTFLSLLLEDILPLMFQFIYQIHSTMTMMCGIMVILTENSEKQDTVDGPDVSL